MTLRDADFLMLAYAAGTLDRAHEFLIESCLPLSPEAEEMLWECEELGGVLLEHLCECAEMSNTCMDAVLARIDRMEGPQQAESSPCALAHGLPDVLAGLLCDPVWQHAQNGVEWSVVAIGEQAPQDTQPRLVHCAPGLKLPGTFGADTLLVLDGALLLPDGSALIRGMLLALEPGENPKLRTDPQQGCLLLIA